MRELDVSEIRDAAAELYVRANYHLGEDVKVCLAECAAREDGQLAKDVFASVEENIRIAGKGVFPLCQDTGMVCVFLEIGQDVHLTGGDLCEAVNEGSGDCCFCRTGRRRDPQAAGGGDASRRRIRRGGRRYLLYLTFGGDGTIIDGNCFLGIGF